MLNEIIKVGDVNIEIDCVNTIANFKKLFPLTEDEPNATLTFKNERMSVGCVGHISSRYETPGSNKPRMYMNVNLALPRADYIYDLIETVGFFGGYVSNKYRFCHGAGFTLNDKGVLLIGSGKSGKSTLTHQLGGTVISDDSLLVSRNEMTRICYHGTLRDFETQDEFTWLKDENRSSNLSCVFILDNTQNGHYINEHNSNSVLPELAFDGRLTSSLLELFVAKGPLYFDVPIYTVGTKNRPEETKARIEQIVDYL